MSDLTAPLDGLTLQVVPNIGDYKPDEEIHNTERFETDDLAKATVITSKTLASERHKVVLDLDLPAKLIPSTTPGHFHLYVDHEIEWDVYANLLDALEKAGLVEPGYVNASKDRGYTAARLPWVRKAPKEEDAKL